MSKVVRPGQWRELESARVIARRYGCGSLQSEDLGIINQSLRKMATGSQDLDPDQPTRIVKVKIDLGACFYGIDGYRFGRMYSSGLRN